MQRVLTAAVGAPLVVAAVFLLPPLGFFLFIAVLVELAAWEYIGIVRPRAAHAPLRLLLLLVPLAAGWLFRALGPDHALGRLELLAVAAGFSLGLGSLLLLSRTPLEESIAGLGILGFGVAYLALPLASIAQLQQADPWLVFLLMAIVWLGDTAAYYVGSRLGRHKMAPTISPKKTWEGSAAGFAAAVGSAAVWSLWRLGRLHPGILAVAAATAVASQLGDLVESMIKRGAGVKDSGNSLPGHGGFLDRIDAMLFAAPMMLLGVWLLHLESL
ncbi:MAG TPA: phosphatidate cytidylyltransferase [Thermoanaerobaculia bacterium]|nr:phosphatidate cytidylyltransferase [Thermoanaerobaculia bacterium]